MSNSLIFITFFTINTIYENLAYGLLLPSLKKFDLTYKFYAIENRGTWGKNSCRKPAVILESLYEFKEDIVWVDSDAKIMSNPRLLYNIPPEYDIGACYLKWEEHYGRPNDRGKQELIDGTIFIRNNKKMRNFVTEWKSRSTDKGINHQKVLQKMLEERKDTKVYNLPREYCYIVSTPHGKLPKIVLKNPVICHYQASRVAKRNLKKGNID